ncbi:MAG TPA: NAD-dependent malic enzyme [Acidobacteriota bacterium]|nr:NAD-dependent malic enzyme [Acidobacteriota bacterium]
MHSRFVRNSDSSITADVVKRGRDVLRDPLINKGSAFTPRERAELRLEGLLPPGLVSIDQQLAREIESLKHTEHPLGKYVELADLQDRNETLFFRLLVDRLDELMPIVYTPTVGSASRNFSHIFRRGRGRWITPEYRGRIVEVLGQIKAGIRLIVVTDNERILGLGDLGAGGMAIPTGKLALYTAAAGLHPTLTLPVSLDVGTDNAALLDDPKYLGWRHSRLRGQLYDELVDEFVRAVRECYPNAVLQWEDFKKANAFGLLHRYRDVLPSFNDDIQGTAAIALAGILAACRATGTPLREQRVAILGAGAAGAGIAGLLRDAFSDEGLEGDDLISRVAMLDSGGLLVDSRQGLDEHKRAFAWPAHITASVGLDDQLPPGLERVVELYKPSILIGTTGQPGAFTKPIVRRMAANVERPAIFPFSNPTTKSEATPEDIFSWTEGNALVATGSPFPSVQLEDRLAKVSQGNNVYIFPGVGLGALAIDARKITDAMFTAAATSLAAQVTAADLAAGALYPPVSQLRQVTRTIAEAVAQAAVDDGVAVEPDDGIAAAVASWIWDPAYPTINAT